MKRWNPRYLAYCKAHGKTPEQMLAHDEDAWPGGVMCGFILWMSQKLREFSKAHPGAMIGPHVRDQDAWSRFLAL
jgi:hypothetical protein